MPDNLTNYTQLPNTIIARSMEVAMSKPEITLTPLYDFQISELSPNNTPFKYHFRHVVEIHDQQKRKSKEGEKAKKMNFREILEKVKTEAVGNISLKIQAKGTYKGPAYVTISCVEAECGKCNNCKDKKFEECSARENAHPHVVTGEYNDDPKGVKFYRSINIEQIGQEFTFKIGIMSTKRNDMKEVLNLREEAFIRDKKFDLNRVKLHVQFSVTNPKEGFKPCFTQYSSTIYNKHNSAFKTMEIKKIYSDNRSPMDGGKEIMITGHIPANGNTNGSANTSEKGESEESNFLQVCFRWTGSDNISYELPMTDSKPEILQSCGIGFKTPAIPEECQTKSDIEARIFLRKSYPCGRKDESNQLPFIFEAPKMPMNNEFQLVFEAPNELLECPDIQTMQWNGDVVENQVQATAPAPQEFSLVNSLANLSAENYTEHIPQILEVMQPAPISNNQMAKILDQNSGGGLVNFLSNMKTMQDVSKTQETKGTKRRPETLVNTEGQLLSNSMFLSKGGPKASNKGQNKVADFDLLSDRTLDLYLT